MGQVHLAYRRPPQHFLLVVLPDQYRQHLDQHAPAAEQHDRRTSTANEVHAVYDVYYYFLSGLTSILIMWFLRKTTDDKKLLAKLEANYQANKANPNKKMSGMAARLEALQKQQQAILEEQKKKQAQNKK